MPSQASNRATMRLDGHIPRLFFGCWLGSAVVSGTISAEPANGDLALAYTTVTGSSANVRRGYKVVITDSSGNFIYQTHVRGAGTISSTSIPVREIGQGDQRIGVGDTITVYSIIVPGDRLVAADSTFSPDSTAYTNQNGVLSPMCCSGGPVMYYLPTGVTSVSFNFPGSLSYAIDDDSSGTLSHSWSCTTATPTSSTSASPDFTFSVGKHNLIHTATDSSNSATHTQVIPVRIYDDDDPPYEVAEADVTLDVETGASARWRLFDDADTSALPDGAMGCLFLRETMDAQEQSFGNAVPSRSHMKWVGFLSSTEFSIDTPAIGENPITFSGVSPLQRLLELAGFSKVLIDDAAPADWSELEALTTKRAILQIARWYTTFCELFDVVVGTYADYEYPRLYVQKQSAGQQMQELADATDARLTCDRVGRFILGTRLEYTNFAGRGSFPTTLIISDEDTIADNGGVRVSYEHFSTHGTVEARALSGGATPAPFFSKWPGVPGMGTQDTVYERWIADPDDPQVDTNRRIGDRAAYDFGVFIDAGGAKRRAFDADIPLPGAYDVIDPAYQEWLETDLDETSNRRGIDLSASRLLARTVSIRYNEDGTAETMLTVRSETAGRNGIAFTPPSTSTQTGDYDTDDFTAPVYVAPVGNVGAVNLYAGTARIAAIGDSGLSLTTNFGSGGATLWATTAWSTIHASPGTPLAWCPDAFAPGFGWLVTSTKVLYVNLAAATTVLKHTFAASSSLRTLDASFGVANKIVITSHYAAGVKVTYSTDNTTFTETATIGTSGTLEDAPGVHVSTKVAGQATIGAYTSANNPQGYRSTDTYVNWSLLSTPLLDGVIEMISEIHCPFHNNPADALYYYSAHGGGSNIPRIWRTNGGSASTDVSPVAAGVTRGQCLARGGISSYTGNRMRMLVLAHSVSDTVKYAFRSDNGGDSWTELTAAGQTYNRGAISGNNGDVFYLTGIRSGSIAAIGLSNDAGNTIQSQQGDMDAIAVGNILMVAGY